MSFILYSMGLVFSLFIGGLAWQLAFYSVVVVIKVVIEHPIGVLKGTGWTAFGLLALVMCVIAWAKQLGAF